MDGEIFALPGKSIETAPARGEATEAVLGCAERANGTIHRIANPGRPRPIATGRSPPDSRPLLRPLAAHVDNIAPTLPSVSHLDLVQDQTSMITVPTATIHHSPIRVDIEATLFHTANKAAAWACAGQ